MVNTVFEENKKFITTIHNNSYRKLYDIIEITGIEKIDFEDKNTIEIITNIFMKKLKKTDEYFLYWMYVIGCHIKKRFNGKWVLVHYRSVDLDKLVPMVFNDANEIWEVGNFCFTLYYLNYRMKGISFLTFYQLYIERVIWKPKLTELNIPIEWFVFLE